MVCYVLCNMVYAGFSWFVSMANVCERSISSKPPHTEGGILMQAFPGLEAKSDLLAG